MGTPLRVLIVDDSETDALLMVRELKHGGYEPTWSRVETEEAMRGALERQPWEVILSNFTLPQFSGMAALETVKQCGLDLPFIMITGTVGEETAVATMKAGAHDYLLKGNLTRLPAAVARELREAAERRERRQVEQSLREQSRILDAFFTSSINPIAFLDRRYNFIRVNQAYADACQRNVSDFPGHNHFEWYPSDAKAIFDEVVRTRVPFRVEVRPFVFPDHPEWGVTYWDWTLTPIVNDAGETEFLAFSLNDVTKRSQLEKERADFMAMIVHDLRSPLTSVVGAASLLENGLLGPVNDEQKKWLGKIANDAQNLAELVNDFLDVSKIEAGRVDLVREEVALSELVRAAVEGFFPLAKQKKISLKCSIASTLPRLKADPRRLEQVFSNLLSNALKFTGEGGSIEVGAGKEEPSGITLWVKDSGIGVPPDEIGGLFEKYRQTSTGRTSQSRGTGLGLFICKMIVEAHGGRIWVESAEGKGATFFFTLPLNPHSNGLFPATRAEKAIPETITDETVSVARPES